MESSGNSRNGVAQYYNKNTRQFLKRASAEKLGAIHRRLYGPGIDSSEEAACYSNEIILDVIRQMSARKILDLGCGVGGTIRYLRDKYSAEYSGITISRAQVEIAGRMDTLIEEADFLDSRWFEGKGPYDVIYAIESLQHNSDHKGLCNNLLRIMRPDSLLVVIDDFMMKSPVGSEKMIRRFRTNWHAHGYTSVDDFTSIFESSGFILREKKDLTELMEKTPILDRVLSVPAGIFSALPKRNAWMQNIVGGNALKQLQGTGLSGYFKLVFQPE